jgi:hypothetical protein
MRTIAAKEESHLNYVSNLRVGDRTVYFWDITLVLYYRGSCLSNCLEAQAP